MSLTNFFTINLPYGMEKNANGEWFTFNREYVPLGWNSIEDKDKLKKGLHTFTKYKGLTENAILKIVTNPNYIQKNNEGEITTVFFYNDATNPQSSPQIGMIILRLLKSFRNF